MIQYSIKRYISIIAVLSIVLFVIGVCVAKIDIIDSISYSVSIVTILCGLFTTLLWKCRLFQGWLVPFPNLNGEWNGSIESTYEKAKKKIPVKISIKQTFFHIQIKMGTKESESNSIVASFNIDKDRNIKQLCYSYQNIPKTKMLEQSPIHYGSVIFNIDTQKKEMNGCYWTGRKTAGDIYLKK